MKETGFFIPFKSKPGVKTLLPECQFLRVNILQALGDPTPKCRFSWVQRPLFLEQINGVYQNFHVVLMDVHRREAPGPSTAGTSAMLQAQDESFSRCAQQQAAERTKGGKQRWCIQEFSKRKQTLRGTLVEAVARRGTWSEAYRVRD